MARMLVIDDARLVHTVILDIVEKQGVTIKGENKRDGVGAGHRLSMGWPRRALSSCSESTRQERAGTQDKEYDGNNPHGR